MEQLKERTDQDVLDSFKIRGFTTVHVKRWTGPEWARGIRRKIGMDQNGQAIYRHYGARVVRRFALMLYGEGRCYGDWQLHSAKPNKVINEGRDTLHVLSWEYNPAKKGFQIMAIGKNIAGSCTVGLATIPSEHTGTGLKRATATKTHTAGTNKSTLIRSFTNSTAGTTDVLRMAMYNSTVLGSGDITICNSFAKATLLINDVLKVTETITMGGLALALLRPDLLSYAIAGALTVAVLLRRILEEPHDRGPPERAR